MWVKFGVYLVGFKVMGYFQLGGYMVFNYNFDVINCFFVVNLGFFIEDMVYCIVIEGEGLKFIQECVIVGYVMVNFKLGCFGVLVGVCYEFIEGEGIGVIMDNEVVCDVVLNQMLVYVQGKGYVMINDVYQVLFLFIVDYYMVMMFMSFWVDVVELVCVCYVCCQMLSQDYDDFFLNLQLKYMFIDNFLLCGSYNKIIG